jgi:hypothetical protein
MINGFSWRALTSPENPVTETRLTVTLLKGKRFSLVTTPFVEVNSFSLYGLL